MKRFIPYSLIATALACGLASAQTTAYTTPVGYTSQDLFQGFNCTGLTLQSPTVVAGAFSAVAGTLLTDASVTYAPVAGRMYVLEIISGSQSTVIQEVPAASISGNTITTPDNLGVLGLLPGDKYKLRLAPTLEEIFTTKTLSAGGVLVAGLSSTGADVVWVPTGTGAYTKYFLHSTSSAFRLAGTSTPTPNIPVVYADGLLIEKKGSASASLVVAGEVKTIGTKSVLVQGFNLMGAVSPVGLNLSNAGIQGAVTPGLSATGADNVWIQQPDLSYIKYFLRNNGAWRTSTVAVDLTPSQVAAINISNGFFIERKALGQTTLNLNVPTGYSSL